MEETTKRTDKHRRKSNFMEEVWKDILGYEDYKINFVGEVFSKQREIKVGLTKRVIGNYILKPSKVRGYLNVVLTNSDGKKMFKIHRLLALSFIPNPENKSCVNHIDGNKSNNKLNNLEWVTPKENNYHAFKKGLKKSRLNDKIIKEIRVHRNEYSFYKEKYNILPTDYYNVISNKTWFDSSYIKLDTTSKVLDTLTGIYYKTISDAYNAYNFSFTQRCLREKLVGSYNNNTNLKLL